MTSEKQERTLRDLEHVGANLGRAAAGALIFALPMLMTMEMWWLGFHISTPRLMVLLAATLPLLGGLSHYSGFESTFCWQEDLRDALIAIAVAALTSAAVLYLFGVIGPGMPVQEIVNKVAVQSVPASIGALLARSLLGGYLEDKDEANFLKHQPHYGGELFLMAVGALFLSLNVAPTEEMILIAYKISGGKEVALVLLSIGLMHAFVYAVNFRGESPPENGSLWSLFLRFTVTGYALVFLVSLFILWVYGRTDHSSLAEILSTAAVLGFPGAIGAAAARLIL